MVNPLILMSDEDRYISLTLPLGRILSMHFSHIQMREHSSSSESSLSASEYCVDAHTLLFALQSCTDTWSNDWDRVSSNEFSSPRLLMVVGLSPRRMVGVWFTLIMWPLIVVLLNWCPLFIFLRFLSTVVMPHTPHFKSILVLARYKL